MQQHDPRTWTVNETEDITLRVSLRTWQLTAQDLNSSIDYHRAKLALITPGQTGFDWSSNRLI